MARERGLYGQGNDAGPSSVEEPLTLVDENSLRYQSLDHVDDDLDPWLGSPIVRPNRFASFDHLIIDQR